MQGEWDCVDEIIKKSIPEVITKDDYNQILLNKIHSHKYNEFQTAAFSFIFTGLIILCISIPSVKFTLINIEMSVRKTAIQIQYDYNTHISVFKNIVGE